MKDIFSIKKDGYFSSRLPSFYRQGAKVSPTTPRIIDDHFLYLTYAAEKNLFYLAFMNNSYIKNSPSGLISFSKYNLTYLSEPPVKYFTYIQINTNRNLYFFI